ncbi:hypothetical protein [Tepidicaulis sp.]|uniref:hypothetical protein n=1 Tax=Tepidicaulis sp. TaxID=1920809 RepID=UPI003B5AA49F
MTVMNSKRRCFTECPFMSAADEGRVHHERRWLLETRALHNKAVHRGYRNLLECFEALTPEMMALPHFAAEWWSDELRVIEAKEHIDWLDKWRHQLAPYDPYCYLATVH